MPTLPLLGHTLHFTDSGAPPDGARAAPVVALHSGGLSSRQWAKLAARLAPRHRVLCPDFLSCGGTSAWVETAAEPYHFNRDVDLVCALLDTLPGPVHLVGHSFGGLVAVKAALRTPGRVRSLSVFEPVTMGLARTAGGADAALFEAEMRPLQEPLQALGVEPGGEAWLRVFIDWWQGPGAWDALPPPAKGQFLAVGKKLYLEVNSLTRDGLTAEDLVPLRMPALVLRSETSPQVERRICALLAQGLPRGTLRQLDGVGHLAPVTHAAQVNELISAHLAAVEEQRD